ncbi:MAG: 3-hydroxyacyl-ACP dehydratase [Bacteroidota bacterium]
MLQNDLYTIESLEKEEDSAKAGISLNVSHPIFKGHFPGQPVLPGACMLQMVKEIMELVTGKSLQLQKANHLKFISLIDPTKNHLLILNLEHMVSEEGLVVRATILRDAEVCLKFNGVFLAAPFRAWV